MPATLDGKKMEVPARKLLLGVVLRKAGKVRAMGKRGAFVFSRRRRHTRFDCDWSSDVCSSDLVIVSIQKQLEQTVGGSAKGILYLSGERSSDAGLKFLGALTDGISLPLTLEGAKRIIDASALTGWGRTEIVQFDPERGRFTVARHNSPIAQAYGPSKKPVCHFLAGWMAGIGRLLVGKELLCEELSCAAQGHDRCEFELQPMPMA